MKGYLRTARDYALDVLTDIQLYAGAVFLGGSFLLMMHAGMIR